MIEEAIQYAREASKVELHMHLEGALTPELILKFAKRNKKEIPYANVDEICDKYRFNDLEEFINIYIIGFTTLSTSADYVELFDDYCTHAKEENIVSAEVFIESQGCIMTGMELSDLMDGCIQGVTKWKSKGVDVKLIPTFLRHLPEDEAMANLDALEPYYDHITAVGLAATEVGYPPSNFKRVFRRAADLGLNLVAHAGEEGPPEYVWEAIDELGAQRIDHGNRAIEDPTLVSRLQRDQIPLTMCPLSNLRLCVVDRLENHPLKRFMDAGVRVTVNSDDPAYFGGYLNENFEQIIRALNLAVVDVKELIANAHAASFVGNGTP